MAAAPERATVACRVGIPDGAESGVKMKHAVAARLGADASFADHERAVLAAANAVCRVVLEATLQATARAQPRHVRIDGVEYEHHHAGTVGYHSLCGTLTVERATYREVGERNGPTVVPLELAAGLIEGTTPALADRVALGYAQGPGRRADARGTGWRSDAGANRRGSVRTSRNSRQNQRSNDVRAVMPRPSVIVTIWAEGIADVMSICPLGHLISRRSTRGLAPSPKWSRASLCPR